MMAVMALAGAAWAQVPGGQAAQPRPLPGIQAPKGVEMLRDLEYARVGEKRLLLDLYLPEQAQAPVPLIIWVHGGAWQSGDKAGHIPALALLTTRAYAVASINYRLSQEATFPAQIHDCKAAVRWLRAHARDYNLNPDRFGAWGSSAGGHLVALLGTSAGVKELEGDLGNLESSSRVQAVCDWFGPTDFLKMRAFPSRIDRTKPDCPEALLVGGLLEGRKELCQQANPITYVTAKSPPFLIMHGDQDDIVPFNQSELLHDALKQAGAEVTFHPVKGAGHGFARPELDEMLVSFFDKHLKGVGK
jgi:acetyl esterase/lipase